MSFYSCNSYRAVCTKFSEIEQRISYLSISDFVGTYGRDFGLIYYFKNLNLKYDELKKNHMKNIRFKRNFQLFKRELEAEEPINFDNPKELFFVGNPGGKLHMAIISNPYCGFCKGDTKLFRNYWISQKIFRYR